MRLYTYSLRFDDGAAPNPFGGVCTLSICKPVIRKSAKAGDWIVGLGPSRAPDGRNLSSHIVYAMLVSRSMSYAEYDRHCQTKLRAKLPDWSAAAPYEHQVGDCLYESLESGEFRQRRGVHNQGNVRVDTGGLNALLAEETFFYFGDRAVPLLERFHPIRHPHQGQKVHRNEPFKDDVVQWMLSGFGLDLRPRILYGSPIHRLAINPGADPGSCGVCSELRIETEADEASIC